MIPARKWSKLDNAAMIVPASMHGSDTRVFRITCELTEPVDEVILQQALDETIPDYSHFNVILRQGFFWYYLDSADIRPVVTPETLPACEELYRPGRRSLMYRVCYFENRVNLEMFHVLADGTGGFMFLKQLISRYLSIRHGIPASETDEDVSSQEEKNANGFRDYYSKQKNEAQWKDLISSKAYRIRQDRDDDLRCRLLEGVVSAGAFIALAKEHDTTAGVLSVALYIESVLKVMTLAESQRPVVVSVPVNLRQFFPSATSRNFFGVIKIVYNASSYDGTLESILLPVRRSFEEQLTKEKIASVMNGYSALEHNILVKAIPLFIKEQFLRYFTLRAHNGTTCTLSNIGVIKMPDALSPYIDHFSAFMATPNMQITVSSFGDKMVFGAVSAYSEHRVLMCFFRRLVSLGLEVTLATNDYDKV